MAFDSTCKHFKSIKNIINAVLSICLDPDVLLALLVVVLWNSYQESIDIKHVFLKWQTVSNQWKFLFKVPRNGSVLIVKVSTYDFKTLRLSIRATGPLWGEFTAGFRDKGPVLWGFDIGLHNLLNSWVASDLRRLVFMWRHCNETYPSLYFLCFIARLRFQDFFFMSRDHSVRLTIWNEFIGPFPNPVALINHKTGFSKWLRVNASSKKNIELIYK